MSGNPKPGTIEATFYKHYQENRDLRGENVSTLATCGTLGTCGTSNNAHSQKMDDLEVIFS